jgi:ribosome maturation factor RimP
VLPGSYVLEVSSPGVDRPLTLPRHWRRNVDRLVLVQLTEGDAVTGRVVSASETAAVLDVDGETRDIPYAEITSAKVQVELRRRPSDEV